VAGLVLDSSIAISWCLPDEGAPEASEAQRRLAKDGAVVVAHWPLEVTNALIMATRCKRIDVAFRNAALRDLAALPIRLDGETSSLAWHDILRLADAYGLTVYDAAYLELASRMVLPLATLDAELRGAAQSLGVAVIE
jgi:predicted nucleic acid-binding protein